MTFNRRWITSVMVASMVAGLPGAVAAAATDVASGGGAPSKQVSASQTPAPTITVDITNARTTYSGSLTRRSGPLRFKVSGQADERTLSIFRIKAGYTLKQLRADAELIPAVYFGDPQALTAWRRITRNVVARGGLHAPGGTTTTATVTFAPGKYLLSDGVGSVIGRVRTLTITGTPNNAIAPRAAAVVTMGQNRRFGGDSALPASGTIRITNMATAAGRWCEATLQRVKPGTTREDVLRLLRGQSFDGSIFVGDVTTGSDMLSPGRSQRLTYTLPAGRYALMCLAADPADGVAQAAKGMVRIVRLG
jgi:hypothetical protein